MVLFFHGIGTERLGNGISWDFFSG